MGSPTIFSGRRTRTLTADGLILASGEKVDFDGVVNYVTNGHAEVNTLGWATYADAAGAAPVDGTGGSPQSNLFIRSTATPLRGLASFLLDKTGAANRQGQGASFNFLIDDADKAKRFPISFDYEIGSGTFADNDVTVWILDVTNNVLIQPAGFQIKNTGIEARHVATFQTSSNSNSYRLIFHISSVSALNYGLKIDNVQVGPQNVTFSTPITDMTVYTPTFTGFGTVTVQNFTFARHGDLLRVVGRFSPGTTTGVEARMSLPAGLVIDAVKNDSIRKVGSGAYVTTVATNQVQVLAEPAVSYFTFGIQSATAAGVTKVLANALAGAGNDLSIEAWVPVTGWSSSAQVVSDSSEGRVVAAQYSGTPTGTFNNTWDNILTFPTLGFDTHAAYSSGSYTVRVPGIYRVSGHINVSSATATVGSFYAFGATKNGTLQTVSFVKYESTNTAKNGVTYTDLISCIAGDVITFRANSNATTPSISGGTVENYIAVELIQGSQTLLGGESVNFSYFNTATTFPASTQTTINYSTRDYDSHLAYVSGTFTVPVSGKYRFGASTAFNVGSAAGNNLNIARNGVIFAATRIDLGGNITTYTVNRAVACIVGDLITVRFNNATGSAANSDQNLGQWFFNGERIGN